MSLFPPDIRFKNLLDCGNPLPALVGCFLYIHKFFDILLGCVLYGRGMTLAIIQLV